MSTSSNKKNDNVKWNRMDNKVSGFDEFRSVLGDLFLTMPKWARLATILAIAWLTIPEFLRNQYNAHGKGDQVPVFFVVFFAWISPILTPIFHLKIFFLNDVLPASVENTIVNVGGRWLLTPSGKFEDYDPGSLTDYSDSDNWSMMPGRVDTSHHVPAGLRTCEEAEICDTVDAFYLHPTTFYSAASWNAPANSSVTSYLSDDAIGPQQANAFNIVGRIFAPRYRQMTAAAFLQTEGFEHHDAKKALGIAYDDARAAFSYYLKNHWDGKRGIIISGHSQGSLLGEMLVEEFFSGKPLHKHLVAAYLPGWTLFKSKYSDSGRNTVIICTDPGTTGCVISWRTYGKGGDPTAFLHVPAREEGDSRVCINPLSWKLDGGYESHDSNKGGLDLMHPWTMVEYMRGVSNRANRIVLPELTPKVADAECVDGNLLISPPARTGYGWLLHPAWLFAQFPGRNLHPYDFNFFFANLRENVEHRVKAWLAKRNA